MVSRFFPLLPALLLFASCQDVIEVDLNSASPTLVVEAPLYPDVARQTFSLTLSTDYYTPTQPAAVTDATVTVSDDAGKVFTFSHIGEGQYACDSLVPVAGQTYTLALAYAGKTYTASSAMRPMVAIDSLKPVLADGGPGGTSTGGYRIQCFFRDTPGQGDYYRLKYFLNGQFSNGNSLVYADTDAGIQPGGASPFGFRAQQGDTVRVELSAIDGGVYTYFSTLALLADGGGGAQGQSVAYANPTSNLSGGALGYFGAFQRQVATVVVP